MSTHPNVILMSVLKPDGLARKTMRDILAEQGKEYGDTDDGIEIGEAEYHVLIMESDYDHDGYQISANEGDLVFHDFVTYGYGDVISWSELEKKKNELEAWSKDICSRFHCSYEIRVTANYW